MGIRPSRDIGRVIYALIEVALCTPTEADSESDFAEIFEIDQIAEYLCRTRISQVRDWPTVFKCSIVWMFLLGGLALLFTRSQGLLSQAAVWLAGLVLFLGWMISTVRYPKPMRFGLPGSTLERRTRSGT